MTKKTILLQALRCLPLNITSAAIDELVQNALIEKEAETLIKVKEGLTKIEMTCASGAVAYDRALMLSIKAIDERLGEIIDK